MLVDYDLPADSGDLKPRTAAVAPSLKSLAAILARCGIALDAAQLQQLWSYHRMLRQANAELNLTRIHNFENMVLKHYVDSLLVLDLTRPAVPT